ncbi:hypothetical protein Ancab_004793 [Ancistrocladus abbreviatus]
MEFKNEEATGPGVLREWFLLVCQAIFDPQNALFVACPHDRRGFYPNPAWWARRKKGIYVFCGDTKNTRESAALYCRAGGQTADNGGAQNRWISSGGGRRMEIASPNLRRV